MMLEIKRLRRWIRCHHILGVGDVKPIFFPRGRGGYIQVGTHDHPNTGAVDKRPIKTCLLDGKFGF